MKSLFGFGSARESVADPMRPPSASRDTPPSFDDDFDVTPTSSSSLHSIFNAQPASAGEGGVAALGYRPVQPPKPAAPPPAAAAGASATLHASLVQVFRNVDGAWQSVGNAGLALVGGPMPKAFQIVLYEPSTKRPFSITTVESSRPLAAPSPQYVSVDDDQANSWSIFFARVDESHVFLQHVIVLRALLSRAAEDKAPVAQDAAPGDGHVAQPGDVVGVQYVGWSLPPTPRATPPGAGSSPLGESVESGGAEKPCKCVVGEVRLGPWESNLAGMRKGGVRYVACGQRVYRVRSHMHSGARGVAGVGEGGAPWRGRRRGRVRRGSGVRWWSVACERGPARNGAHRPCAALCRLSCSR